MKSNPETPVATPVTKSDERRWDCLTPFLTAGFRPATTARRTDHFSVRAALIVHVFAVVLIVIAVTFFIVWSEADGTDGLADVSDRVMLLCGDVLNEFAGWPPGIRAMVLVSIVASWWGGYVLLAVILSSWGARDERVRKSVWRAVHRAWRHTPHVLQVIILASIIAVPLYRDHQQASDSMDSRAVEAVLATFTDADRDQDDAYWRARQVVWDRHPFFVRHGEELCSAVYFAGGLWLLWGFLSAIGAGGKSPRIARPPMCEACGYNLTGAAMEGRCPECGRPVADSLGPNARLGTSWQRKKELGRWTAFWRTAIDAIFHPTQVGRQLIPFPAPGDHRVLLLIWLPLIFICTGGGALLCFWSAEGRLPQGRDIEFFWLFCPTVGYFAAIKAVSLILIAAGLVGCLGRWKHKRNMLPSAIQAACCAGGFLIVWLVVAFSAVAALLAYHTLLYETLKPFGVAIDIVISVVVLGPNAICFLIYLWLVATIAQGTRFANSRPPPGYSDAHRVT